MIDFYFRLAVVEYGVDPIQFWEYTPRDIDLISERKLKEHREKYEFEAWKLSYLLAPHVKKPLKPKDIYDYDRILQTAEMTEEEEFDSFDKMFMNSEQKKKKQSEEIVKALKKQNAKKKEAEANGN